MSATRNIIGFFVAAVLLSGTAFAATLTLHPDGIGNYKQWGVTGCSGGNTEWQCVDEAGTPDTSDYLRTNRQKFETFTFSDSGLASGATVNSVTMYYYAMQHNNVRNRCFEAMTRSGGTDYLSGIQLCAGTSWAYQVHTYTTNPATGSAWTVAEVDALEAGMHGLDPDGGGRIAQVYALVNYTNETNSSVCGNNIKEAGEVCDGTDLDGQTCSLQGFDGGTLACNATCDGFNTTACYDNTCSDTDGYDSTTQGTVSGDFEGSPYNFMDYCFDSTTVAEYYCFGGEADVFGINCTGNSTCVNGACV